MTGSGLTADNAPQSGEATPALAMRLFGPMEVTLGGQPLPRLRSRKGLWLLALLALREGRAVERTWLAGMLWPDCDEEDARRSLRQSLHDLRLALGPEAARLATDSPKTLHLDVSGASIDVLAFDAAIGRGDLDALETAVRLYRGPFLEDCAEEWVMEERRRREEGYLTALETLAAGAVAQKEYAASAGYLRSLVGIDPFREESQRALMHALAGADNLAGALLVYRQYREMLRREMSMEPSEETTALFRRLRADARRRAAPGVPDPVSAPASLPALSSVPRSLPFALTELVGRQEAVAEVVARLAHALLVTLTGPGGMGKTRLALQVAELLGDEYADGACFADLAPLADPLAVPEAVRTALGLSRGDGLQSPVAAMQEYLATRRLLLVLDNCEHLLDACAELAAALLNRCPGLRILATSRQALGLRGETVWSVPSLTLPPDDSDTASPSDYAAVQLFVERARAADASFVLTEHNAPAVITVCRRLDGIPLAIELAAARVRSLSVEEIRDRLQGGFGLLKGGGKTLLPRQQTLATIFDWSWDLLTEPERGLLRCLSVFAGGWTLALAEAICPTDGLFDADEVVDLLTSLVDKSLVVYRPAAGGGTGKPRYVLLETVRQYAGERLRESGDRDAAHDRHRDHFLAWALAIKATLEGPEQAAQMDRLEAEHDNLRAALSWCEQQSDGAEAGLRLAAALWRFWYVRGYLSEGRQWTERMLAHDAGSPPSAARAMALNNAGILALVQGDYAASRAFYEDALAIHRQLENPTGIASTCNNLGNLVSDQGDYAAAQALYEESLALFRQEGHRQGIADALNNLGLMAFERGDYEAARPLWEESLALEREGGNKGGIATSLGNLGLLADSQDDFASARASYAECLALYRQLGYQLGVGDALVHLGNVFVRQGDFAAARPLFEESVALERRLGNLPALANSLEGLAAVVQGQDRLARAVRLWGASRALRESIGCPPSPVSLQESESRLASLRDSLGADAYLSAFSEGQTMTWEQAAAFALALD